MTKPTTLYTIRGAGLSLVPAAVIFAFTLQPLAFALVALGAAAGFIAGRRAERRGVTVAPPAAAAPERTRRSPLARVLQHQRTAVRFAGLLGCAAVLFIGAWYAGYHLLPEGALRARAAATPVSNDVAADVFREWLSMAWWNATLPVVLILAGNACMRVNGYPLGYLPPLFNVAMYGLIIGTNSYAVPMPERLAPSLAVLQRAGPYEFAGYLLIAAATATLSRWEIKRLGRTNPERVVLRQALGWGQWLAVGAGIAAILLAAWREAVMIVAQ